MEEDNQAKEMLLVIILGFTSLILGLITVMSFKINLPGLESISDYSFVFGLLSFTLFAIAVIVDKKYISGKKAVKV
ncbi:MAG: hypothetical protein CL760_06560 [Chloroflexi bacterium]|nr:hypothetical protein [Chloroflexota bacterium]|tara:strand:- start:17272 stop:17499 length:228 start_codon:yes stop_codon:yes gene_type:complete